MGTQYKSVWDALADTPAEAENMKLRSSLTIALQEHIRTEGLTQKEAAKKFGVTQPRISDLTRGRIDLFSIDTLVNMLATAASTSNSTSPPRLKIKTCQKPSNSACQAPFSRISFIPNEIDLADKFHQIGTLKLGRF